jgi:hypothetical protein
VSPAFLLTSPSCCRMSVFGMGKIEPNAKPGAGGLGEALEGPDQGLDPPAFEVGDDRVRGAWAKAEQERSAHSSNKSAWEPVRTSCSSSPTMR